ncbi:hypothetical protein TNCV_2965731 [Trichonephila clavipes]|nr:hypothetical protein TNCV_2965731 [Trichonephila clavipes]
MVTFSRGSLIVLPLTCGQRVMSSNPSARKNYREERVMDGNHREPCQGSRELDEPLEISMFYQETSNPRLCLRPGVVEPATGVGSRRGSPNPLRRPLTIPAKTQHTQQRQNTDVQVR